MRKLVTGAISAGGLLACASTASAQVPPAATYNWAGNYVGLNVGGIWDESSLRNANTSVTYPPYAFNTNIPGIGPVILIVPGTIPLPATVTPSRRGASVLGGGQLGRNWQWGSTIFGIEADIQGLDASQRFNFVATPSPTNGIGAVEGFTGGGRIERNVQGSARGRLGYAWDRWLLYGTAGVAVTQLSTSATYNYAFSLLPGVTAPAGIINPSNASSSFHRSDARVGPTLGPGIEYALWDNVSLGLEYRHTFYGSSRINLGSTPAIFVQGTVIPSSKMTARYGLDTDAITLRLNWRFSM